MFQQITPVNELDSGDVSTSHKELNIIKHVKKKKIKSF